MSVAKFQTTARRVTEAFKSHAAAPARPIKKTPIAPFSMRLTDEERAFLDAHCGGKPWAAYIRECVFGAAAKTRRTVRRPVVSDEKLAVVLSELGQSRLSSNLNQLAKSANMGTLDVSDDVETQLADACGAILAMRQALFTALGLKT